MSLIFAIVGFGAAVLLTLRNAQSERISQFIFLFSAVHALYIFPKVLSLELSSSPAAEYFRATGATFTASYMALLCFLSAIVTYTVLCMRRGQVYAIDDFADFRMRVLRFSILIGSFGLLGFIGLLLKSGGLHSYFIGLGFYQLELYGLNVWLIFISRFTYPAIAAMALLFVLRPTRLSFALLAIFSIFPLMNVIFLFRRSDLLLLGFIAIYALTVSGKVQINRTLLLISLGAMSFLIIMFPFFRQEGISAATGWDYGTSDLTVSERLIDSFEINDNDEISRAASLIEHSYRSGEYEFGAFVWNSLVNQFVPASVVGGQRKAALYLGRAKGDQSVQAYFDEEAFFYVAPMGFAQAYKQFGPFGWAIFAFLGAMLAGLERSSYKLSNRVFLMVAIPIVCLAASNDISSIPARLATFWLLTRPLGSVRLQIVSNSVRRQFNLPKVFVISEVKKGPVD